MTGNPLLHGIRAVVFDAVGTVIHPRTPAPVVYAEVGRRFGSRRTAAEIASRFITAFAQEEALDYVQSLQTSEVREVKRWQHIVSQTLDDVPAKESCFQELFQHFSRPEAWFCEVDAAATIETLALQGYGLGLASNYDRRLRSVVAGLPALRPLQQLLISSEIGWRKPSPQFFLALSQALNLAPANILYVGDDPDNDYAGARAAGLGALLFDPQGKHRHRQARVIRALSELAPATGCSAPGP